jgi:hypothetical protein
MYKNIKSVLTYLLTPCLYNPLRILVSFMTGAHFLCSLHFVSIFFIYISRKSFSTSSNYGPSRFHFALWLILKNFGMQVSLIHSSYMLQTTNFSHFNGCYDIRVLYNFVRSFLVPVHITGKIIPVFSYVIKYYSMKTYVTLVLVGGEWSASRFCRFIPGDVGSGRYGGETNFLPLPGIEPRSSSP